MLGMLVNTKPGFSYYRLSTIKVQIELESYVTVSYPQWQAKNLTEGDKQSSLWAFTL